MFTPAATDVAIIGIACRFPGARNLDEFWLNLKNGQESITFFTPAELEKAGIDSKLIREPAYVAARGVLSDVEWFDAGFFGYSPAEASLLDPQHRVFLECAHEAFEDAGYITETFPGSVAVFAGASVSEYLLNILKNRAIHQAFGHMQVRLANERDYLPLRTSYELNLRGPSINVQTACSTSLVAVHLACQSLCSHQCDMALAGAVSINGPQTRGYLYTPNGIDSKDGHTRPFDKDASGTTIGSGVGLVVLKRLSAALDDNDHIYAVIKGTAVNNDGADKVGMTAPSVSAQIQVISEAFAVAGVQPQDISYIETHGTATQLGDLVEMTALREVFKECPARSCAAGAVKSNIGHLDVAAGMAGLIKTVMALNQQMIPPTLNHAATNSQLGLHDSAIHVAISPTPWTAPKRFAGVSSFGIGGTNAHVVLENPMPESSSQPASGFYPLPISAQSPAALETSVDNLRDFLRRHEQTSIADISYTLCTGRKALRYRQCISAANTSEALRHLQHPAEMLPAQKAPAAAFLFDSLGPHSIHLLSTLYRSHLLLRTAIDDCLSAIEAKCPGEYSQRMLAGITSAAAPTLISCTLMNAFIAQYALGKALLKCGVQPKAVCGRNTGVYASLALSGAVDLPDVVALFASMDEVAIRPNCSDAELCSLVERMQQNWCWRPGAWPLLSSITGGPIGPADLHHADVWRAQTSSASHVGVPQSWLEQPDQLAIRVGSANAMIVARGANGCQIDIATPQRSHDNLEALLPTVLGRLWTSGISLDWSVFFGQQRRKRLRLPTTVFERQYFWIQAAPHDEQPPASAAAAPETAAPESGHHFVLSERLEDLTQLQGQVLQDLDLYEMHKFPGLEQRLDELCTSYIAAYLKPALSTKANDPFTQTDAEQTLLVRPPYRRFLHYMLETLRTDGLLERIDGTPKMRWVSPVAVTAPHEILNRLRRDFPSFRGIFRLLEHCATQLQQALSVKGAGLSILFPGGKDDLLRQTLAEETVQYSKSTMFCELIKQLLVQLSNQSSRPLRVLEVGAGTGILTSLIAPLLAQNKIDYHVTDISRAFVETLRAAAAERRIDGVQFAVLDISQDPAQQGFAPDTFDVVIALNVLHATQDVRTSLKQIQMLLAPRGLLACVETIKAPRWVNCVWGLTEEWWSFADGVRSDVPLLDLDSWEKVLKGQGFSSLYTMPGSLPDRITSDSGLLLAQKGENHIKPLALASRAPALDTWTYVPVWKQSPPPSQPLKPPFSCLVFCDSLGIAPDLARRLSQEGAEVTLVRQGASWEQTGPREFQINPANPADYQQLTNQFDATTFPRLIIHLWSLSESTQLPLDRLNASQDAGLYSLMFLAQAMGKSQTQSPTKLLVCSNNMQSVTGDDVLYPDKSTILAAVKLIPHEYPNITCRSIDFERLDQPAQLVNYLIDEIALECDQPAVAYRGRTRWTQEYQSLPMPKPSKDLYLPLRNGGVYLLLGGLGGIGLVLARHLAQTTQAKLVLVARTSVPERQGWDHWLSTHESDDPISYKIAKIREIESLGAEVMVASADVSNVSQMQAVLDQVEHQFGMLNGVIHCAGVTDDGGVIQRRTRAQTEESIASKVRGTLTLDRLLGRTQLDFLVLCSSRGSAFYKFKFGELGYVAANDFLNSYAHYKNRTTNYNVISINWTDWENTGMRAKARERFRHSYSGGTQKTGATPHAASELVAAHEQSSGIEDAEGVELFSRILHASRHPQVLVSAEPLEDVLNFHNSFTPVRHQEFLEAFDLAKSKQQRQELSSTYEAPGTAVEQKLAEIWKELLGVDQVGLHDDFFELGGDSLIALRIISRLREQFQVDQTLANLFEVPTLQKLGKRIETMHSVTHDPHAAPDVTHEDGEIIRV
jgi:acyl transferase domain-containing protein/acyl carrier protein/predicted O-methyltransferase YrrM